MKNFRIHLPKLFGFMIVLLCLAANVPKAHADIIVAGTNATLFGGSWTTATNSQNKMTQYNNTNYYYLAKTGVSRSGTTEYKVVDNGNWYPANNQSFSANGTRNLVFIYNTSNHDVSCLCLQSLTVAGSQTELLGSSWGPADANNDMSTTDGIIYTLSFTDVNVTQGSYQCKVALDHAWTTSWPGSNYNYSISFTGTADVTFTFNAVTKEVSVTAVQKTVEPTIPTYYITGDNGLGLGGFQYNPTTTMTYDSANDVYTYSYNVTTAGNYYFTFGDGQGSNWTDFNNNHRFGPTSGNVEVSLDGTWVTTQRGSGSYFVNVDAGPVTITLDVTNMRFKVVGTAPTASVDYYVVGTDTNIFPNGWNTGAQNLMTENNGTYTWTASNVHLVVGTNYEYKVLGSDNSWHPSGDNASFSVNANGTYDVVFTFDGNTVTAVPTLKQADPTYQYTFYVYLPNGGTPYLYTWNGDYKPNGGWPCTQLAQTQLLADENTWYVITDNSYTNVLSAIVNLGNGNNECANITDLAPGTYYITWDGGDHTTAQVSTTAPTPPPTYDYTIYVRYKGNATPYEYIWDGNDAQLLGAFPGTALTDNTVFDTEVINGYTYYKYIMTGSRFSSLNMILNEGDSDHKTADLTVPEGTSYFTYGGNNTVSGPNAQADPAMTYYAESSFAGWTTDGTQMTSNGDGSYSKTFTGVSLNRGETYQYKVYGADGTNDGVWFGPEGNATFTPDMSGTYDVTITLNSDGTISHTLTLTQAGAIYLTGDGVLGGFSCDQGIAMTYSGNGIYTYQTTLNNAATTMFVFADGQNADWDTFNSNYRIGPTDGDTDYAINTVYGNFTATQKAGGNYGAYVVKAGAGTLTFYYDAINMQFQVVGTLPPVVYYVVGNDADLFGAQWTQNPDGEMTYDSQSGNYTWTISNVHLESNGDYQFKVNGDDDTWYPGGDNMSLDVPHDGTYNLTVTFDGTDVTYQLQLVEPDVVYLIGYANSQQWLANAGIPMVWDSENGYFKLTEVVLTPMSNFAFTTMLGANTDDWSTVNDHRFASTGDSNWAINDYWLDKDEQRWMSYVAYQSEDHNWYVENAGIYNIYLNPIDHMVRVELSTDTKLYISYGVGWSYEDNSVEMSTVDDNVYQATITLNNGDFFLFSTALSDESAWGAVSPSYEISELMIGFAQKLEEGSVNNYQFTGTTGKYIVVVNLEKGTVTLRRTTDATKTKIYLQKTPNVTLDPAGGTYNGQTLEGKRGGIYAWNKLNMQTQGNRPYEWAPNDGPTNYTYDGEVGNDYGGDGYLKDLPDTTTLDQKSWYAWSVSNSICEFYFIRSNLDDKKSQKIIRRSGEIWLTWIDEDATINRQDDAAHLDSLMDVTREYYAVNANGVSDNSAMIEGHYYVYYTNTTGWDSVYCYAWYEGPDADQVIQYTGDYPGSKCNFVGYDKDGYEVWCYDFGFMDDVIEKYGREPSGVIFDNGKGGAVEGAEGDKVREQTGDLVFDNGACYDYLGMIYLGNSLNAIINGGIVNGPKYTVEDDLIGVYYDEDAITLIRAFNQQGEEEDFYIKGALYAKDMENYSFKSRLPEDGTDYVYDICAHPVSEEYPGGSQIQIKRKAYDQSNWVKLVISPNFDNIHIESTDVTYDREKFEAVNYEDIKNSDFLNQFVGRIIPGGSMSGNLVSNINPQMHITNIAKPIMTETYEPNVYTTGHFNDTVVFSYVHQEWNPDFYDGVHRTLPYWAQDENENYFVDHMEISPEVYKMFYVAPKPQEIAYITWAVFDHPYGSSVNGYEVEPDKPGAFYAPMNWNRTGELWDGTTIPDNTDHAPYGTTYGPYSNGYMQYGAFQVNWSLFEAMSEPFPSSQGRTQDPWYRIFQPGQAYKILALIRYAYGDDPEKDLEYTAGVYSSQAGEPEYNEGPGNHVWNAPRRTQERPANMERVEYDHLDKSKFIIFPLRGSNQDTYGDEIGNVTTVKEVKTARTVVGTKYYNLMGVESDRPFQGLNIIVTTYSDGSRQSRKEVR